MTSTHAFPAGGLLLSRSLAENWWLLLLRGIAGIAFGILAMIWPDHALRAPTYGYGAYAFVDGIFSWKRGFQAIAAAWRRAGGSLLSASSAFWLGSSPSLCLV